MVVIISTKGREYYVEEQDIHQVRESLEVGGYFANDSLYIPKKNVEAVVSEDDY